MIGLTGGVGMGKSTAGDFFRQRGVPLIDTDLIARQVVEPDQPVLAKIRTLFGDQVFDKSGALNRRALARHIFREESARRELEALLHPLIRSVWEQEIELWRNRGASLCAVGIPLLFETDARHFFDFVICVACSAESQVKRLAARGWTNEEIQQRIAAQLPTEDKILKADFLIWTDLNLAAHAEQVDLLLARLKK